ncbi:hypothetical protein GCM10009737_11500 [Nocardioides lentus]|uniref:TIGR02234 family membrane protein n=1 Tax=Nocardioides lentus TaxID=338077 RepID=A0ABN2P3N0_9ACTN
MPETAPGADGLDGDTPAPGAPTAAPRRRTMGPVLLGAAVAGALLAVSGDRPWLDVEGAPEPTEGSGQQVATGFDLALRNPAVTALALVALAALGVVLVTRGRVRRVVAVLALLAAAGTAVAVGSGWLRTPDRVAEQTTGTPLQDAATSWTLWAWTALPAAALLLAACAVAVRDVRRWPEMGRRYDAPTSRSGAAAGAVGTAPAAPTTPPAERSSLDLWKAMDEGQDPTDTPRH